MGDGGKEKQREAQDDATDSRTLDEIQADENVGDTNSDLPAPAPAPDEGGGREDDTDVAPVP